MVRVLAIAVVMLASPAWALCPIGKGSEWCTQLQAETQADQRQAISDFHRSMDTQEQNARLRRIERQNDEILRNQQRDIDGCGMFADISCRLNASNQRRLR